MFFKPGKLTEFVASLSFQELEHPTVIEQGAYILIAVGAFIFFVSFLGYCGAIKESRVLLTAYGLFVVIIAVLQIAFIVVAAINKVKAEGYIKGFFHHTIRQYYTTSDRKDAVTLSWDFMMAEVGRKAKKSRIACSGQMCQKFVSLSPLQLECCGVENYRDFEQATEFVKYAAEKGRGQIVPEACCKLDQQYELKLFKPRDENCLTAPTTDNSNMNKGCYEQVSNRLIANVEVVMGVCAAVIAVQILGIIFAFCLCKAVGGERDYHYKY